MNRQHPLLGPLGLSLLGILIILSVIAMEVPAIVGSAGTAMSEGAPEQESVTAVLNQHELAMAMDRDRFNGRSFFYVPSPPPRPAPKVERPIITAPPPPPPPPPVDPTPPKKVYPKNYTGPPLKGIIGATAFFRPSGGGMIFVNVGETQDKIELLDTSPPRSIEVKYDGGGPYTVDLFEMAEPDFLSGENLDAERASRDIIAAVREESPEPETLADGVGWPAGTTAGDEVRVVFRDGPVERAISGTLSRANAAWLVLTTPSSSRPIELYKRDILSIQNLAPSPVGSIPKTEADKQVRPKNDNSSSIELTEETLPDPPTLTNGNRSEAPEFEGENQNGSSTENEASEEMTDLEADFNRQVRVDQQTMSQLGESRADVLQRIKIFQSWIAWWAKLPDACRAAGLPASDELKRMVDEQRYFLQNLVPAAADNQNASPPPASPGPSTPDG